MANTGDTTGMSAELDVEGTSREVGLVEDPEAVEEALAQVPDETKPPTGT